MTEPGSLDLSRAVRADDVERVGVLLAGNDVPVTELDRALRLAVGRRQSLITHALLDAREQSDRPLHVQLVLEVARLGDQGLARRIFDLVPDLQNVASNAGRTPLHAASFAGNLATIELLLDRGVDVDARRAWETDTPLHLAAANGRFQAVERLLDAGADIEARDRDGMTALAWADMEAQDDIAELLIERGADPGTRRTHLRTELHRAAGSGRVAAVRRALSSSTDVDAVDLWGDRALHLAVRRDRPGIVEALIEAGADVNAQNDLGETPLVLAASDQMGQHPRTVRLLLDANCDPDLADHQGWSALHALVFMDAPELLKLALTRGANVEARNQREETPFLFAAVYCHWRCMKVLLAAGADPTVRASEGQSAADLLVNWGAMTASDHDIAESARVLKSALIDATSGPS